MCYKISSGNQNQHFFKKKKKEKTKQIHHRYKEQGILYEIYLYYTYWIDLCVIWTSVQMYFLLGSQLKV